MYQDMNFLYNREEQEYNEFMAKLFKKGKEVSDDLKSYPRKISKRLTIQSNRLQVFRP